MSSQYGREGGGVAPASGRAAHVANLLVPRGARARPRGPRGLAALVFERRKVVEELQPNQIKTKSILRNCNQININ